MRLKTINSLLAMLVGGLAGSAIGESSEQFIDEAAIQSIVGTSISHELAVDLNADDVADRLIATTDCGNAGCTYFCFLDVADDKYRFVGTLFLHRLGFEVLRTRHNGLADILSYSRVNAAEGSLIRHEFNGSEYEVAAKISGSSGLYDLLSPTTVDR